MAKVDAKHQGPGFWEKLQPRERVLVMRSVKCATSTKKSPAAVRQRRG